MASSAKRISWASPRSRGFTTSSNHFLQCLVLPSSGSEPVGAVEKILLIDGVQYFHHRLLHDLVLQSGNRDWSLLPVLLRYVDPAERLGLVLSFFEPLTALGCFSRRPSGIPHT